MPMIMQGYGVNAHKVVVSLCDFSGNWPRPWNEAGHTVVCFDLKHGDDVTDTSGTAAAIRRALDEVAQGNAYEDYRTPVVDVVLAAPPCTDFTVSGAQYWPAKDADGRTAASLRVVDACCGLIAILSPRVWALENPVGRLPKLRPGLGKPLVYVQPYRFAHLADDVEGERYTKKTGLWGVFNAAALVALEQENDGPVRVCKQGSWVQKLGGKSERTKELRSMTPQGISLAFYLANKGA